MFYPRFCYQKVIGIGFIATMGSSDPSHRIVLAFPFRLYPYYLRALCHISGLELRALRGLPRSFSYPFPFIQTLITLDSPLHSPIWCVHIRTLYYTTSCKSIELPLKYGRSSPTNATTGSLSFIKLLLAEGLPHALRIPPCDGHPATVGYCTDWVNGTGGILTLCLTKLRGTRINYRGILGSSTRRRKRN